MTEPPASVEVELKSLRDRPFELLAELERRGRAVSAQLNQDAGGREWVGVALRMAGDLYLVAREETREVLGVPAGTTRVPGAKPWIKGLANVMHGGEGMFMDRFVTKADQGLLLLQVGREGIEIQHRDARAVIRQNHSGAPFAMAVGGRERQNMIQQHLRLLDIVVQR